MCVVFFFFVFMCLCLSSVFFSLFFFYFGRVASFVHDYIYLLYVLHLFKGHFFSQDNRIMYAMMTREELSKSVNKISEMNIRDI